jgi:putative oxidoreductase
VTAGIRIFVGLVFVFFGALKFVVTEFEVAEFVRFGFPDSAVVVYLVGAVEVVAGLMLVLGLATRLAALGLAVVMAGAILTAGLTVGGPFHLGLAPALLAANLWLLRAGAGTLALDRRLSPAGTR